MSVTRRALLVLGLLLGTAGRSARAQSNTAEMLQRAIRLYENVEIEQSLVILNQIISPASPFVVSEEQRIIAFKYLGAALALQRGQPKRDSAVNYFRAALERDPFTDLDPQSFSPTQIQVFSVARSQTFAVGIKPVLADTIDPRTQRFRFRGLSTHNAHMRLEIRSDGRVRRTVYDGPNDGLREIEWDALGDDGRLLPEGRYQLVVIGQDPSSIADSTYIFFELSWLHEPLEDTLPSLTASDLLAEQYPASAATGDLLKGFGVTAAALVTQGVLSSSQLGGNRTAMGVVAGGGAVAGVAAFFYRQSHRAIPANMAENMRRKMVRDRQNQETSQRNEAKLQQTRLAIAPAAGAGR